MDRRLLLALPLLAALPALAAKPKPPPAPAPPPPPPTLTIADVFKEGACPTDAWADAAVTGAAGTAKAAVTRLDWKKDAGAVRGLLEGRFATAPIAIAALGDAELDRLCGCQEPAALATWIGGLAEGRTAADTLRASLSPDLDVTTSLTLVMLDHCANRSTAAMDTLIGLWDRIPAEKPEERELRLTRVAHDMAVIARASKAEEGRLRERRDALESAKDSQIPALDDWVVLNRVLLDDERTIAWYQAHKGDTAFFNLIDHQAPNLFFMLVERKAWADAGSLIRDPLAWLAASKPVKGGLAQAIDGYAALLAAGRTKDASKYAKELLKAAPDDTACKLVSRGLDAGVTDKSQKGWLKSCDAGLQARWTAAQ